MDKITNFSKISFGSYIRTAFLFLFLVFGFQSCQKEELNKHENVNAEEGTAFLKSSLPDPYVKGEDIPEIISSLDQSLKTGNLEERNGSQLPFKFLGYDKSRAFRVYNDSFEITSYAFLAYTDLKDLNKVVNVVVTQKKNGKPGKPYLYEYTTQRIPNQITPKLIKIVKYNLNGVKVDVPGGNFNPCIDVICNEYNMPIGSGSVSGSGGSSGGGTTGGTWGTGGSGSGTNTSGSGSTSSSGSLGSGTVTCVQDRTTYKWSDNGGYTEVIETWCSDGTYSMQINYHLYIYAYSDCCDPENVNIGVISDIDLNSYDISNFINSNGDLAQLQSSLNSLPVWLADILWDVVKDVLIEVIERQLKINLADDIKNTIKAAAQGDLTEFLLNALNIVKSYHPGLKVVNVLTDTGGLTYKATVVLSRFSNMAHNLGDVGTSKILNALKSGVGNLVDDINVSDWPKGIIINGNSNSIWQSIITNFGNPPVRTYNSTTQVISTSIGEITYYNPTSNFERSISFGTYKFRFY